MSSQVHTYNCLIKKRTMNFIYTQVQLRFVNNRIGWKALPFKALWLALMVFICCIEQGIAREMTSTENHTSIVEKAATVSGVVKDAAGEPLIGVNVLAKGTNTGIATDVDGKYSLNVPEGATTLVFSYTGYKTVEEVINGRTTIDVVMVEDAELVDEVVVIGYGNSSR